MVKLTAVDIVESLRAKGCLDTDENYNKLMALARRIDERVKEGQVHAAHFPAQRRGLHDSPAVVEGDADPQTVSGVVGTRESDGGTR